MKHLLHQLAHLLGTNCGTVITWHSRSGRLMIGFRCTCGQVTGIHPARVWQHKH